MKHGKVLAVIKSFQKQTITCVKGGLYNKQRQGYGMIYDHSISSWAKWKTRNRRFENFSAFAYFEKTSQSLYQS